MLNLLGQPAFACLIRVSSTLAGSFVFEEHSIFWQVTDSCILLEMTGAVELASRVVYCAKELLRTVQVKLGRWASQHICMASQPLWAS